MLVKSADDKSKRLALLEELQQSKLVDPNQKKWLREELMRQKKGMQGERDSAHYLDLYFKDAKNHVLLHDLRFVVDGDVAQIDHMIINRAFQIYLLETKNYAGNLVINGHGEFTVEYDDGRYGIPSPIEQSLRHERILGKLLEKLDIVGRTQKQPEFHHVVMMHPKAIITRPPSKTFDSSNVIKADQFPTWHQGFVEKLGVGAALGAMLNLRNLDTIKEWGEKLVRQHRPADLLALPDFMRPKETKRAPRSQFDIGGFEHPARSCLTGRDQRSASAATSPAPRARLSASSRRPQAWSQRRFTRPCARPAIRDVWDCAARHTRAGKGRYDVVLAFAPDLATLRIRFAPALAASTTPGRLWVCWPRRSSGVATDLTENIVREPASPKPSSTSRSAPSTTPGPAWPLSEG